MAEDLRHRIARNHPVIGREWRLLEDDEVIGPEDETALVSTLLSMSDPEDWSPVSGHQPWIGMTVSHACNRTGDVDGWERLFRRRRAPTA